MEFTPYVAGVYRTEDTHTLGERNTIQDSIQYLQWFVIAVDKMRYVVQPLSSSGLPSAIFTVVTADDFRSKYIPQPAPYRSVILPLLRELRGMLSLASSQRELDLRPDLEKMYRGLQVSRFLRGGTLSDFELAKVLVDSVPASSEEFRISVSRFISSQGIDLRKTRKFDQSVACYKEALLLSPQDDHLYFNLARVQYDMNDLEGCRRSLEKALDLNPDLYVADRFLNFLDGFI